MNNLKNISNFKVLYWVIIFSSTLVSILYYCNKVLHNHQFFRCNFKSSYYENFPLKQQKLIIPAIDYYIYILFR